MSSNIRRIFNLEIKFYSPTGDWIGSILNNYDRVGHVNMKIKDEKIGGLKSFNFSISKEFDIPFYNLMKTEFWISGYHWFTGELLYRPEQDRRDIKYEYEGRSYTEYMKKLTVNKLYTSTTIKAILIDLIQNELAPNSPVLFDTSLINPPDIAINKIEFNKKSIWKVVMELLKLSNYDYKTQQYRFFVNNNVTFEFQPISTSVQKTFFEGFQYQNPDVKTNIDNIVNAIEMYRAKEKTNDTEFVSKIIDSSSIELFDERLEPLIISDFVDTTTAENIARSKIELLKDPVTTISIKDLDVEDESPYVFGFYNITNKQDTYVKVIDEGEDLSKWNIVNLSKTAVTESTEKVLTGKKAYKIQTATGGFGEYIELILDEPIYFPTELRFYVSQYPFGSAINVQAFDTEGNTFGVEEGFLLTEEGNNFALEESSGLLELESGGLALELLLERDYQRQVFDITNLRNIEKLRINFTNEEFGIIVEENNANVGILETEESTSPESFLMQESDVEYLLYLDRFEVQTKSYKQNRIILDSIKYEFDDTKFIASAEFGDDVQSGVSEINKINDKQRNLYNIFEKTT